MARRGLLVLLALGSFAGFAAGFASWQRHSEHGWGAPWSERRMDAVAEACVRAARRVDGQQPSAAASVAAPAPGSAP